MTIVTLRSSDDKVLTVEKDVARVSRTIGELLKRESEDKEIDMDLPIPFNILEKIVTWCKYNKSGLDIKKNGTAWHEHFLYNIDTAMLSELIRAADYLQIDHMVDLGIMVVRDLLLSGHVRLTVGMV